MATILDLLQALNRGDLPPLPPPAPSMPIPLTTAGQPATPQYQFNPIPEMAPQAPAPGLDMGLVNQYAGQAPTAPTLSEPTTIDKIAAVLGGIAYGPGYAQALREERQRPQREFEAARERYQGRRAQGLELAQRKQERQQAETQQQANMQQQQDFQLAMHHADTLDKLAAEQRQFAQQLRIQQERDKREEEKQKAIEERQVRIAIGKAAQKYRDQGAKGTIPNELANRDFNPDAPVSAAADKWYSINVVAKQAQADYLKMRAAKTAAAGGTGGGEAKLAEEFENLKRQLYPLREQGDVAGENSVKRRIAAVGAKLQAKGYEVGYGENPYQKPPQAQGRQAAPQAGGQTFSRAQVQAYARKNKKDPAQVEADLKARGFNVQ